MCDSAQSSSSDSEDECASGSSLSRSCSEAEHFENSTGLSDVARRPTKYTGYLVAHIADSLFQHFLRPGSTQAVYDNFVCTATRFV